MPRFPIEYEVDVQRGAASPLEIHRGERPPIASGPPPEFGGTDHWWNPEQLLVSAASTCFATTLFAVAQRANVHIGAYHCRAKGVLDRTPTGVAFTAIHLSLRVRVLEGEIERARKTIEDAKRHCFVANTLRCPVNVDADVTAS